MGQIQSDASLIFDAPSEVAFGSGLVGFSPHSDSLADQGAWGTCVTHAFANHFANCVKFKYGMHLNAQSLATVLTYHYQNLKGMCVENVFECYNDKVATKWLPVGEDRVFRFKVRQEKLKDFEELQYLLKQGSATSIGVVVISTGVEGHGRHAVAPYECRDGVVKALNSWKKAPELDVTSKNFKYGWVVNVTDLEEAINEKEKTEVQPRTVDEIAQPRTIIEEVLLSTKRPGVHVIGQCSDDACKGGKFMDSHTIHYVPVGQDFSLYADEALCPKCGAVVTPQELYLANCQWRCKFRTRSNNGKIGPWRETPFENASNWFAFDAMSTTGSQELGAVVMQTH